MQRTDQLSAMIDWMSYPTLTQTPTQSRVAFEFHALDKGKKAKAHQEFQQNATPGGRL